MNKLKTVKIQNRDYVMVNERIKYFREHFEGYALETEIVTISDKECVLKAYVKNNEGRVVATGMAREVNGDSFINKTSYVENAESSAWGRALGNFGIGIDTSVASADEVANAVKQQTMDITPHGDDTTQTYLDNADRDLNKCTTEEQLEECKVNLRETAQYFKKGNNKEAVTKLSKLVADKTEELKGE